MPRALSVRVLLLLAALLLSAPNLAAGLVPLDDVWFKVNLKAVGRTVKEDTLNLKKAKITGKAFLHVTFTGTLPDGATYDWELWTKPDGTWLVSDTGTQAFIGDVSGDQLAVDIAMNAQLSDGKFLDGRATLLFKLKVKNEGALKKARILTLGGETTDGTKNGTELFVGSFSMKGHRVKVGKLPFEP